MKKTWKQPELQNLSLKATKDGGCIDERCIFTPPGNYEKCRWNNRNCKYASKFEINWGRFEVRCNYGQSTIPVTPPTQIS